MRRVEWDSEEGSVSNGSSRSNERYSKPKSSAIPSCSDRRRSPGLRMPRLLSVARLGTPMGSSRLAKGASPVFETKLEKSPGGAVQGVSELHISVKHVARGDPLLRACRPRRVT